MKKKEITMHDTVREALSVAFIQLLEKRPYERITASDIARRAGVSRSSFYRIFGSKETLMLEYLQEKYRAFFHCAASDSTPSFAGDRRAFLLARFDFIRENGMIFTTLEREGLLEHFFEQLDSELLDFLSEIPLSATPYQRAIFSGASAGVIRCWIRRRFLEMPEELLELLPHDLRL